MISSTNALILISFLVKKLYAIDGDYHGIYNLSNINASLIQLTQSSMKQDHIVEYILLPFIFTIGTMCNFLTFIVLRRKKMRHQSTYFYMAVLAVADQLVLLVGCLNYWLYLFMEVNLTSLSDYICKFACVLLYGMFHFCVWVVVIMTVERFIAVAIPLQANRLCTVKRAKLYTLILACIIFMINMHFLFSHAVLKRHSDELGCQPKDETYDFLMLKIWPWIDASVYSFIPLTLLIIFNILIIQNLLKASKSIEKLNSNNTKKLKKPQSTSSSKKSFYLFSFVCLGCCCSNNNYSKSNKKLIKPKNQQLNDLKSKSNGTFVKNKSIYHQNLIVPNTHTTAITSSSSSTNLNNTSSVNRRLTIMLLVISVTFFLTSTPIVTLQTIEQAGLVSPSKALVIIRGVFIVLQYLNHSINFFLYAVTGKTFRREFFALFKSSSSSSSAKIQKASQLANQHLNSSYCTALSKNSLYNQYTLNQQRKNQNDYSRKCSQVQV